MNNPPGPGLGATLGLGRRVLGTGSGDEGSASDMEVGVAVCGGELGVLVVRTCSIMVWSIDCDQGEREIVSRS